MASAIRILPCVAALLAVGTLTLARADDGPNYHLVGWVNTFLPGGGQLLLGNYGRATSQFGLEVGTFGYGYSLSNATVLSLDGAQPDLPVLKFTNRISQRDLQKPIYGSMLQEFGIKFHMVNVFDSYRQAAGSRPDIDQRSTLDLFLAPYHEKNLTNPWVYVPLAAVGALTIVDYYTSRSSVQTLQPLRPYSNFLYAFSYSVWEPLGSGAPEEMYYRGFLQHEVYEATNSPAISILASTAAFAFSHAPGPGRLTAAVAGGYLGYLAYRYNGNLAPGITLHYWASMFLGLETMLLGAYGQHVTPPTGFLVQVSY